MAPMRMQKHAIANFRFSIFNLQYLQLRLRPIENRKSKIGKMNLKDKKVLVTGGTRGIGGAAALALARAGADVAIVGRNEDGETLATRQAIQTTGRRCELFMADCGRAADA